VVQVEVKDKDEKSRKTHPMTDDGALAETDVPDGGSEVSEGNEEKPLEKLTRKDLLARARELRESAKKNYELYLRSQAEVQNIKRRAKKDKEEWVKFSNENLIKQLLPVMDNLENAILHAKDDNAVGPLKEGVELTLKGLRDTLEKAGLEEVKAAGEAFDPNFHQAVSEQPDETAAPGQVIHVLQKGYTLNQRLIRPAMVVVSSGPGAQESSQAPSNE